MNHSEIVSFLWGVADLIRDTFKRGKYQDVILPLTVLRRLDCVLAGTKEKVLAAHATIYQLDVKEGESQKAIAAALAAGPGTANGAFETFDQAIQRVSVLTQQEFDGHIRSARGHITGLAIAISLAFLLVAILVLYGFQQRIGEYR